MDTLKIQVNGEYKTLNAVRTVEQLLEHLGRSHVPCAVEVNQQLVTKAKHSQYELKSGDSVELVTLVGGG